MLQKSTGPGLFRLFLALMVFVYHSSRFGVGLAAVYIFFALSGYWIFRMYLGRYSKTRQPYLTYLISRAWRLLPTFYLVNLFALAILFANGELVHYWNATSHLHFVLSNLLLLGYSTLRRAPLVPAWSLDIEMQFYFIAPLLAIFLARRLVTPILFLLAAGGVSLAAVIWHIFPGSLLPYLVFFLCGMTAASADWIPSKKYAAVSIVGTALLIVGCLLSPFRGVLLLGAHPGPLAIYSGPFNCMLALCMVPYALYTTGQQGFGLDAMFADLSYIIYLLHHLGTQWMSEHPGNFTHRMIDAIAAWVTVILLSIAIWKFYDHPINRMRSRWVKSRMRLAAQLTKAPGPIEVEVAN